MESRAASPRTLNSLKDGSVSDFTRQDAKSAFCHFERREKSFSDPSQTLGMTGLGSHLARFASLRCRSGHALRESCRVYVVFVTVNLEPVMGGL